MIQNPHRRESRKRGKVEQFSEIHVELRGNCLSHSLRKCTKPKYGDCSLSLSQIWRQIALLIFNAIPPPRDIPCRLIARAITVIARRIGYYTYILTFNRHKMYGESVLICILFTRSEGSNASRDSALTIRRESSLTITVNFSFTGDVAAAQQRILSPVDGGQNAVQQRPENQS